MEWKQQRLEKETVTVWQTTEIYLIIKLTSQRMLENV